MKTYEYVNLNMLLDDLHFLREKHIPVRYTDLKMDVKWKNEEQRKQLEPELFFVEELCRSH